MTVLNVSLVHYSHAIRKDSGKGELCLLVKFRGVSGLSSLKNRHSKKGKSIKTIEPNLYRVKQELKKRGEKIENPLQKRLAESRRRLNLEKQ